jgi:hypothetical protein
MNVDSGGHFNGVGTITPSRGAVPPGGYPSYSALYYGTLQGDDLTLYASYTDGQGTPVTLGPYHATYGQIATQTDGCL